MQGPLPISGRIRWAMHLRHTGAGSGSSSAAASEAAAVLDKLIAAAAAAASTTSGLGSSSSSSAGDADGEAVAAMPGGRELLTGALAVVRYHRATAPHEVGASAIATMSIGDAGPCCRLKCIHTSRPDC